MSYIKNAASVEIDLIIASADLIPIKNESSAQLLNGTWFVQTIGAKAEKIEIEAYCSWAVLKELVSYADTKENLTIDYLDFIKSGFVIGQPKYDVYVRGNVATRLYSVSFELAVVSDV